MTVDQLIQDPVFREQGGAKICDLFREHTLWLQRNLPEHIKEEIGENMSADEMLMEVGRRVLCYNRLIETFEKARDVKSETQQPPLKRPQLHRGKQP